MSRKMNALADRVACELGFGSPDNFISEEIADAEDVKEAIRRMLAIIDDSRRALEILTGCDDDEPL